MVQVNGERTSRAAGRWTALSVKMLKLPTKYMKVGGGGDAVRKEESEVDSKRRGTGEIWFEDLITSRRQHLMSHQLVLQFQTKGKELWLYKMLFRMMAFACVAAWSG